MVKIRLTCSNPHCDNVVERWPSRLEYSRIVYCSVECQATGRQKRETVTCAYCGKPFERIPFRVNENENYCCREHWQAALHEESVKGLGSRPLCDCGCGERVESTRHGKWCRYIHGHNYRGRKHPKSAREKMSRAAQSRREELSERVRGRKNPMWRDGHDSVYFNERKAAGWNWYHAKRMRQALEHRHHNKCELCGAGDIPLELHHIDHDLFNNSPDNFQLLCRDCHAKATYEFIQAEHAES
jgi:hypothetical protein